MCQMVGILLNCWLSATVLHLVQDDRTRVLLAGRLRIVVHLDCVSFMAGS